MLQSKDRRDNPSLCRVAVVFFNAVFLMGFLDDYGHRVLANVESDAHRPSPPFGDVEQPPSLCHSSSRPLQGNAIVHERHSAVKDGGRVFVRLCACGRPVAAQRGRGRGAVVVPILGRVS